MEYIKIKAEVFRILRAHEGKASLKLLNDIKEHLGDNYSPELVLRAITELED